MGLMCCQGLTVVQKTGGGEGVDEGLGHGVSEGWPESGDVLEVEKC